MMIEMSFGIVVKSQGASWLFFYNLIDTCFSLLEVKQVQMTFNLFHCSRHRVPLTQDEGKGGMKSRVV